MLELQPLPRGVRILTDAEGDRITCSRICVTCHGTGSFRWLDDDGEPSDYKCNCRDQRILHRYLLHSGVETRYQRLRWADAVSAEPGALDAIWHYLANSDAYLRSGCGLILHGSIGSGKTLLSTLLLKTLAAEGHDCYFTTFSDLIDRFVGGWRSEDDRKWFISRISGAGVLVIDDVGREFRQRRSISNDEARKHDTEAGFHNSTTMMAETSFDAVMRHRVAAAQPTILTTNLDLVELQQSYGSNIMSLLTEAATTYGFTGADFRPRSQGRMEDEIKQNLTRPLVVG